MRFQDADWLELVDFVSSLGGAGERVRAAGVREDCERYLGLLLKKNEQVNLTAVTNTRDALWKHFADSFALLMWEPLGALVDWGSGGGFPGLPLVISRLRSGDQTPVHFVDSIGKKVRAIEDFASALGIKNSKFVHGRGEEVLKSGAIGKVDTIVMRAVAPAERAVHWVSGAAENWVFLLGPQQLSDWQAEEKRLASKDMLIAETRKFSLPHGSGERFLLRIRKRST
jgi:16S rRNA (guanine527-N7)-methyltransferase